MGIAVEAAVKLGVTCGGGGKEKEKEWSGEGERSRWGDEESSDLTEREPVEVLLGVSRPVYGWEGWESRR
jgi:hypothetical protein